jgi:peptidoglycan/xylan/chitin deacetylase (PgdA/CDA1 family)
VADPPAYIAPSRGRPSRRKMAALGIGLILIAAVAIVTAAELNGAAGGLTPRHGSHQRAASRARRPRRAHEASGHSTIQRLIKLGLPIYCAGHRGNAVAFTFDDGPGPYTHLALVKLARAGERATFFVVGTSIDRFPGYLTRELNVAALGDHTDTHAFLPALSPDMITSEIKRAKLKIEADSEQTVNLFRPPYGSHDAAVDRIARRLGLLEVLWNVDSADSLGADYAQIIKNVEAGLRPGAIILMHENRGQTIRALTTLLPALQRRHLRSVSLPQLLAIDPPSNRQVRKGRAGCGIAKRVALPGTGG